MKVSYLNIRMNLENYHFIDGDIYLYHGEELVYIGNTTNNTPIKVDKKYIFKLYLKRFLSKLKLY